MRAPVSGSARVTEVSVRMIRPALMIARTA